MAGCPELRRLHRGMKSPETGLNVQPVIIRPEHAAQLALVAGVKLSVADCRRGLSSGPMVMRLLRRGRRDGLELDLASCAKHER